ncbi:Lipase 2 [Colletotrichum fructicola]|nr:Lipase 2 [Colletotrichum fructicola]KAF4932329.1 Lipase 2 [Colletotrichum fructicola]KAF5493241.1 Lipase 2 [Colletotrichum fructicola]
MIAFLNTLIVSVLATGAILPASCHPLSDQPHVKVRNGTLTGRYNSHYDQDFFLGIPYAKAPEGDLRFQRALPSDAWEGSRGAAEYGASCYGNSLGLEGFSQPSTSRMSEDCLFLNIIRPAGLGLNTKLPVLVWIHGGAWAEGSASDPRYNGSFLVQQSQEMGSPIIFASFNYRLGVFGLLPGSLAERDGITNVLLHDQRQALQYLQDNVAAFGGDPDKVTLMGESAGAGSIGFHLLAYGGRDDGLFHAAIAQSGGPFSVYALPDSAKREEDFQKILSLTNCENSTKPLHCLRDVPAATLNAASIQVQPYFTIDGEILPDRNSQLLRTGKFVKVPLLIGVNRNEGTSFLNVNASGPLETSEDFIQFMKQSAGQHVVPDAVLQEWLKTYQNESADTSEAGLGTVLANPGPEYGSQYGAATLWMGDFLLGAGRRYANQMWSDQNLKSYSYFFDTATANLDPQIKGATHAQEIAFVFGNKDGVGWEPSPFPTTPEAKQSFEELATIMSQMWISFAVTKSPNHHRLSSVEVEWPVYSNTDPQNVVFSATDGLSLQADSWRAIAMELLSETTVDLGRRLV